MGALDKSLFTPYVSGGLSRGLANQAFAIFVRQESRFWGQLARAVGPLCRNKKAVGIAIDRLARLGESTSIIQVIARTPNARQATTSQFIPHGGQSASNNNLPELAFNLLQITIGIKTVDLPQKIPTALTVSGHAVERLYQRLNTLDLAVVTTELHDAMLLTRPLSAVVRALGLRQIAVPTSTGTFRCSCDARSGVLVAKTWVQDSTGGRWEHVVNSIRNAVAKLGGESAFAAFLSDTSGSENDGVGRQFSDVLTKAVSGASWLTETYSTPPDPKGDLWRRAREASDDSRSVAVEL
ncbi:MAG: hypothetical protein ABI612_24340 [Betaproteobacteria bacterium]